jgi:hypothetical protein
MLNLALWLKRNKFRLDQVQTFLPTPMAHGHAMYHTELNPLKKVLRGGEGGNARAVVKQGRMRKLHKAFLRYHDPENWPMLREALKEMGREELIGNGKHHLIPSFQPAGTGRDEGKRWPEGGERTSSPPPRRASAASSPGKPAPGPGSSPPRRTRRGRRQGRPPGFPRSRAPRWSRRGRPAGPDHQRPPRQGRPQGEEVAEEVAEEVGRRPAPE